MLIKKKQINFGSVLFKQNTSENFVNIILITNIVQCIFKIYIHGFHLLETDGKNN